jgi:hypothetical protein
MQVVVQLPKRFGEEMWRVFSSSKGLFVSTLEDKEKTLADDAAPSVIKALKVSAPKDEPK